MPPSSFFFLQADENQDNSVFLDKLKSFADTQKSQVFVIDRPLGDNKYVYEHKKTLVLLIPKYRIIFLNFGGATKDFEDFFEDFTEDLGSISDKYRYKNTIGRPRDWKKDLTVTDHYSEQCLDVEAFLEKHKLVGGLEQKKCELLISLLTGSINDIDKVKGNVPDNLLDKVKQKILLFDGDQTRFVYQTKQSPSITIQGLSGTGKTELLLHKLKEIYTADSDSKILLTCHNHVLAHTLKIRIPTFFNFMKVEEQIKWDERLWCVNAWGSAQKRDSGAYSYICNFYNIAFHRYSIHMPFDNACKLAIEAIKLNFQNEEKKYAFDYILIDESQDFPESFFELCRMVTKKTVYIAGDVFQSIFATKIVSSIAPDFLLSKCYRTEPRTLMFAHGLGMGLFENPKLRWLEDDEWKACGYKVEKQSPINYRLTREPLKRFEDLEGVQFNSIELVKTNAQPDGSVIAKVLKVIEEIKQENPTVGPEDIGVILLDANNSIYPLADALEEAIPRTFGWEVNKAHESKVKVKDTLFISNRNNVKGLEFPFVICITDYLSNDYQYRNTLYMTITRSFIKTYLLLSEFQSKNLISNLEKALSDLNQFGHIDAIAPTEAEKLKIKTTIKAVENTQSWYEFVNGIFDELNIIPLLRKQVFESTKSIVGESFEYENVKETVKFVNEKMSRGAS